MSNYVSFYFTNDLSNTCVAAEDNPSTDFNANYCCNDYIVPKINKIYFSDFRGVGISARDDIERSYTNNDLNATVFQLNDASPGSIKDIYSLCSDNIEYNQQIIKENGIWRYIHTVNINIFSINPATILQLEKLKSRRIKLWLETTNNQIYLINSIRCVEMNFEQAAGWTIAFSGVTNEQLMLIDNTIFKQQNII